MRFGTMLLFMILVVEIASATLSQTPPTQKPTFELASIKRSLPDGPHGVFNEGSHERLRLLGMDIAELTAVAFDVKKFQVLVPGRMDKSRYDVVALVAPEVARMEDAERARRMRMMAQALLEDRFQLRVHRETRDLPIYALTLARSGLRPKISGEATGDRVVITRRPGHLAAEGMATAQLIDILTDVLDRPVTDETGIKGTFNVDLNWMPDNVQDGDQPSLFTAIQEQLGLKIESRKAPMTALVIDHSEPPSDN